MERRTMNLATFDRKILRIDGESSKIFYFENL